MTELSAATRGPRRRPHRTPTPRLALWGVALRRDHGWATPNTGRPAERRSEHGRERPAHRLGKFPAERPPREHRRVDLLAERKIVLQDAGERGVVVRRMKQQ